MDSAVQPLNNPGLGKGYLQLWFADQRQIPYPKEETKREASQDLLARMFNPGQQHIGHVVFYIWSVHFQINPISPLDCVGCLKSKPLGKSFTCLDRIYNRNCRCTNSFAKREQREPFGQHGSYNLERSWILLVVLKSRWIRFRSLKSTWFLY